MQDICFQYVTKHLSKTTGAPSAAGQKRGNPNQKGESLKRRLPTLLEHLGKGAFEHGSGRLDLAHAVTHPANPLTARVLVNRVWQHHFGTGLVRTPSDFGLRSEPPSHPELLDYLAFTFRETQGWSLKELHRSIVLSRVYLQKSDDRSDGLKVDVENRLLWKFPRCRLDFEATRDALLAVTGRLERKIGGPSVREPLSLAANRRTLYSYVDRLNVPGLFRTFDFPSPDATSPQRENTTIAPQALFLMNHPFVMECARNVMKRADVAGKKTRAGKSSGCIAFCSDVKPVRRRRPWRNDSSKRKKHAGGVGKVRARFAANQ